MNEQHSSIDEWGGWIKEDKALMGTLSKTRFIEFYDSLYGPSVSLEQTPNTYVSLDLQQYIKGREKYYYILTLTPSPSFTDFDMLEIQKHLDAFLKLKILLEIKGDPKVGTYMYAIGYWDHNGQMALFLENTKKMRERLLKFKIGE